MQGPLGDVKSPNRFDQDRISALTFDKEGLFLSVGDHDGRIVVFSFKISDEGPGLKKLSGDLHPAEDEEEGERHSPRPQQSPQLQFFEEIFAFDPEFNFQKSIEVSQQVTALEWMNRGYYGHRPCLLAANEKIIKLF